MPERREFVMLAKPINPKKHKVTGWFASEKMDGIRALWDGGISRGLFKSEVPWANNDKDERYVRAQRATGLWTRYGNILHAPDWFLDQLPNHPLDGEMFTDRKSWQMLSSIIKRLEPDTHAWGQVTYNVFEIPPYPQIFQSGLVNNPNYVKQFDLMEKMTWLRTRTGYVEPRHLDFQAVHRLLDAKYGGGYYRNVRPVAQTKVESDEHLEELYQSVLSLGGEGLILRNPKSYWEPKRSDQMIKIKDDNDDEATVTGYIWGRKTDKGSKLLGMMGALVLDYNGKRLELSGFTDSQREMRFTNNASSAITSAGIYGLGIAHAGQEVSYKEVINPAFPIGTRVTFKYRELSDTGIPKEARFFRKRDSE